MNSRLIYAYSMYKMIFATFLVVLYEKNVCAAVGSDLDKKLTLVSRSLTPRFCSQGTATLWYSKTQYLRYTDITLLS